MKIYRIHLSGWTASFRYPNMISGYQPTLPVPPMSTIHGLISAAMGRPFVTRENKIGFVFLSGGKAVDLETIYQMGKKLTNIKSNVIRREFLFDVELSLYTDSNEIAKALWKPYYPLLLGRSGDLAHVYRIDEIDIEQLHELIDVKGTILPFAKYQLPAMIQALPVSFTDEIPRRNMGTKPYCLVSAKSGKGHFVQAAGFHDSLTLNGKKYEWDVYWQEME